MLPSRGLTRAHGLVFQNQILSRAPVRLITRQTTPTSTPTYRPTIATTRRFGTSLRYNGRPLPRVATVGLLSGSRIGAAGILGSQTILFSSTRRFASTDSTDPISTPSSDWTTDLPNFDASSLVDMTERVGFLSSLGLDFGLGPTSLIKYALEHLHFTAGLPWWAAIAGLAVLIRGALAYPALVAQQESLKSRKMRQDPLYRDTQQRFMIGMVAGSTKQSELLELRMQMKLLQKQANVKTWKMFLPALLQIPIFFGGLRLLRTMVALPVPGLESGGVLWFTDLTIPDPLFILPCIGTALMIMGIRRSTPAMDEQQLKLLRWIPWVIAPIGIAVTIPMGAGVQLFLACMAIGHYLQMSLFQMPMVRRLCGMPPLESTSESVAPLPPASPFSNPGGAQYQAPRTINTTATEGAEKPASGAPKSDLNPITYFKNMVESAKEGRGLVSEKISKYKESSSAKSEKKQAAEYEKRRFREENEKYHARREEQGYNMAQRRANRNRGRK